MKKGILYSIGQSSVGKINATNTEAVPVVDIYSREHPQPYTKNISVPVKTARRTADFLDLEFFNDKLIVGISVRQQSAANDCYSKNGALLVQDKVINSAFVRLSMNNVQVHEQLPVQNLINKEGKYSQVILEGGLTLSSSSIEFAVPIPGDNDGREIEFIFYYVPMNVVCYQ